MSLDDDAFAAASAEQQRRDRLDHLSNPVSPADYSDDLRQLIAMLEKHQMPTATLNTLVKRRVTWFGAGVAKSFYRPLTQGWLVLGTDDGYPDPVVAISIQGEVFRPWEKNPTNSSTDGYHTGYRGVLGRSVYTKKWGHTGQWFAVVDPTRRLTHGDHERSGWWISSVATAVAARVSGDTSVFDTDAPGLFHIGQSRQ